MLRRFRGESVHKVDQKGRVSVPAPFRRVLEEGDPDWTEGLNPNLVLIYGMPSGHCLEGYTIEGATKLDEKVSRLPSFSPERRALERLLNTHSVYAQVDENGRIVLPARLREKFGLGEEALFAGMGEHFQVWAPGAYREDMAGIDDWRAGLDPDSDPFALFLFERTQQRVAERALRPDVHSEINGAFRPFYALQQLRYELVAIIQDLNEPSVLNRRTHNRAECGGEVR